MLTIVFAMTRFHAYVYGKHDVTVHSDHKPLMAIVKKPLTVALTGLQRILLRLKRYVFTVEYIPGSQILIADALSRANLPGDGATELNKDVLVLADHDQQETLLMVASQATIELMKKAAVVDDQHELLRHQISIGWPAATADIPTDLREFATFAE